MDQTVNPVGLNGRDAFGMCVTGAKRPYPTRAELTTRELSQRLVAMEYGGVGTLPLEPMDPELRPFVVRKIKTWFR